MSGGAHGDCEQSGFVLSQFTLTKVDFTTVAKGQLILKANCQAKYSSKK